MADPVPFDNLLTRLVEDSRNVDLVWQVGILAVGVLVAWGAVRLLVPVIEKTGGVWRAGVRRVAFPLAMLLVLLLGRELARHWLDHTHLLNLAIPLVLALAGVRLAVYALRYALKPRESLRLWERTAAWLIWGAFALHVTGLLPHIHAAMEALSFQSGSHRFSLWLLFQAAAVIVVALVVALSLARFVESRLMGITQMNLSLRMALAKAVRTVLLILAVLVALPAVGIDLTVLSVFGGALGVGIGFGLQKVASNYISGFIILLDRSVRIGDLVTVDNKYGQVSEINTRYTLLKALDGTETIVPNETLITQTVVNHSLSKPNVRIALPVQVSYDTDLERAEALMLEAAHDQQRVIYDDPDNLPRVYLKEFADNGVMLELAVWIRDPSEGQNNLRSDINWAIWRRFKAAGIEMPFPQRVLHFASPGSPLVANNP
ncbi:mechanosensitive ion channel family protein [Thiobacillus sedimenti]|uniref:Mechanosensitive ion channel domain-containing protein n=1 Tax=Thiobacillus sedimenti TaxID=3110231 RepID=A0ABZ1CJD6_9PROT|nr:mechanosensitive ion channel domain-containing protein [Thiobacillus sp. SCUT-2]WRS39070.1 mechanosensitive ion channel domain-containing protein [Thiobacillus sp. SCUT-2]